MASKSGYVVTVVLEDGRRAESLPLRSYESALVYVQDVRREVGPVAEFSIAYQDAAQDHDAICAPGCACETGVR